MCILVVCVCLCKVLLVCNMYLCNCNIFHCIHAGGRANEVRLREKNEGAGGDLWSQNLKLNWRKQGRIIVEAICCGNGINWCFIVLREGALPKQIEMTNKTSPNWSIVLMNKFPGQKCFVEWEQFSFKGLASYCKAETTFTFYLSILTLSNSFVGIDNREMKSESGFSFAIASQPFKWK